MMPYDKWGRGCLRVTSIAVCEDNEMERIVLMEQIKYWAKERNAAIDLHGFADGKSLLQAFEKHRYQIVFLDILMSEIDGIAAGRKIRELDCGTEIIFCTASADFAIEAYEVHARDYLLKPYEKEQIQEVLDKYSE